MNTKVIIKYVLPLVIGTSLAMVSSVSFAADTKVQQKKSGIVGSAMMPPPATGINTRPLKPTNPRATKSLQQSNPLSKSVKEGASRKTVTPKAAVPGSSPKLVAPSSGVKSRQLPNTMKGGLKPGSIPSPYPGGGAIPGSGGGFGAPPRGAAAGAGGGFGLPPGDAADQIRADMAARATRPRITDLVGYSTCVDATEYDTNFLRIRGSRFGDAQSARRVEIVPSRSRTRAGRVGVATVSRWSNNEIKVQLPSPNEAYRRGQSYKVVIRSSGSDVSNYSRSFEICRNKHRVSGEITLDNCPATASRMTVTAQGGRYDRRYTVRPASSTRNEFGFSYEFDALPAGDYTISTVMGPSTVENSCSGGTWSPRERRVSLDHRNASAVADFRFGVAMDSRPVPINMVRGLLNDMLTGTRIRLHNNPTNESYIEFPESAGGFRRQLNIPVFTSDPFTYYVNDINLSTLTVTSTSRGLKMSLQFEADGIELIKQCRNNILCEFAGDINMDMSIDVYFTLIRHTPSSTRGIPGISIGDIRVVASPNAQMSGLCASNLSGLCDALTQYKPLMKRGIENGVKASLENYRFKNSVYTALRPTLNSFNIGNVESVTISGPNFVIRHTP